MAGAPASGGAAAARVARWLRGDAVLGGSLCGHHRAAERYQSSPLDLPLDPVGLDPDRETVTRRQPTSEVSPGQARLASSRPASDPHPAATSLLPPIEQPQRRLARHTRRCLPVRVSQPARHGADRHMSVGVSLRLLRAALALAALSRCDSGGASSCFFRYLVQTCYCSLPGMPPPHTARAASSNRTLAAFRRLLPDTIQAHNTPPAATSLSPPEYHRTRAAHNQADHPPHACHATPPTATALDPLA